MELIDRPLLTIAIPTYNRALLLERNLTSICNSIKGFENLVEVIISDNNSNDNTAQIALSFKTLDYIHYFRNEYNIGFTYNYIKIVNQYARGRYCWIIGDDDFIREDSISYLINALNYNDNVSFISIAFDMNWKINQLTKCNKFKLEALSYYNTYELFLKNSDCEGNLFNGFISASVFETEILKNLDKSFISKDSFDLPYYNMYPQSCYFALTMKNKLCLKITEPLFYANIDNNKGWEFALSKIYLVILPFMYNYHLELGYEKINLIRVKNTTITCANSYLFRNNLNYKDLYYRLNYLLFVIFEKNFYKILFNQIVNKIKI